MSDVREEIRAYIEANFIMATLAVPLADADSFLERHILDSTGFLELVGFLEETYAIKVADEEMVPENLDCLDSLVRFVLRKRGA